MRLFACSAPFIFLFAALPSALLPASPATADDSVSGAIAVSPTTGAIGTISGPATRAFEADAALAICARDGATDCTVVAKFTNTCATVARAGSGDFFAVLGEPEDQAEVDSRALDYCKSSSENCKLFTTFCAG